MHQAVSANMECELAERTYEEVQKRFDEHSDEGPQDP